MIVINELKKPKNLYKYLTIDMDSADKANLRQVFQRANIDINNVDMELERNISAKDPRLNDDKYIVFYVLEDVPLDDGTILPSEVVVKCKNLYLASTDDRIPNDTSFLVNHAEEVYILENKTTKYPNIIDKRKAFKASAARKAAIRAAKKAAKETR